MFFLPWLPVIMGLSGLEDALVTTIGDFLNRGLPLRRILLVASLLKHCRVDIPEKGGLIERILKEQKADGGWVDCEDTAWAVYYLSDVTECETQVASGLEWLLTERCGKLGWGFCKRDQPCIPITGQILHFLPAIPCSVEASSWLEKEWRKDLLSPINLNYKAAFYLLAYISMRDRCSLSETLFFETIDYLICEQRENGSWGPWKCHPAPSECFITGICLGALALSRSVVVREQIIPTLNRGIEWIAGSQLKNGLFPTHYIEEGSAWLFFGWEKTQEAIGARSDENPTDRQVSSDAGRDSLQNLLALQ